MLGGSRLYCMAALIRAGASFLTLAMGYIGLPRQLAERTGGLQLHPVAVLAALAVLAVLMLSCTVPGCLLDGLCMVVLPMRAILPTVQKAGIDLLWFGIFTVLLVELAQISPPVGCSLLVL